MCKPRYNPHPGALFNPDYFAMEIIEGRMDRAILKQTVYGFMYGAELPKIVQPKLFS